MARRNAEENQMTEQNDQPFVDHWPMWDEPLSKITAPFDIAAAREKLARRFNVRRSVGKELRND
jgi:hypothetical protein